MPGRCIIHRDLTPSVAIYHFLIDELRVLNLLKITDRNLNTWFITEGKVCQTGEDNFSVSQWFPDSEIRQCKHWKSVGEIQFCGIWWYPPVAEFSASWFSFILREAWIIKGGWASPIGTLEQANYCRLIVLCYLFIVFFILGCD